jgi:hypothetical protein
VNQERTDEQYRREARRLYAQPGTVEIDDEAVVSRGNGGAYVAAWVWVPAAARPGALGGEGER